MRRLILAAVLVASAGSARADQVNGLVTDPPQATPTELKTLADGIRPMFIDTMKAVGFDQMYLELSTCIGLHACENLTTGKRNMVAGACAGTSLRTASDDILIGAYTAAPTPDTSGFVNIGNKLCFWRDSGQRVACPPPEPECAKEVK